MDSLNRLLQLSGIHANNTSKVQEFGFNRAKGIAEFLINMSEDLTPTQKKQITKYIAEAMNENRSNCK